MQEPGSSAGGAESKGNAEALPLANGVGVPRPSRVEEVYLFLLQRMEAVGERGRGWCLR